MSEANKNTIEEYSSSRLITTLGFAGFLSGLLLVAAYLYTLPMIEANKAKALEKAIYQVLPGCTNFETLVLTNGKLDVIKELKATAGSKADKSIYAGYDDAGQFVGFAIPSEEPGFQDLIVGIFGYQPEQNMIVGFEILESKETPGLGDKIIKDRAFRVQFESLSSKPTIVAVKRGEKQKPNEVEAITGATISSKTVVRLLNNGVEEWQAAMEDFMKQASKN